MVKTSWNEYDYCDIYSNITISVFGSSLLVAIPAILAFYNNKNEIKQKIIFELTKIENLINDLHFQTTFLKNENNEYQLDFSFEKTKYNLFNDVGNYLINKESYDDLSKKIINVFNLLNSIELYDYSSLEMYFTDYIGLLNNEKYVHLLYESYNEILCDFMLRRNFKIYEYGARQYESSNASIGQFFDIWLKKHLLALEPIYEKLEELRTIYLICRLRFYKKSYRGTLQSNEKDKKDKLKNLILNFFEKNNIKKNRWTNNLIKKLNK